MFERIRARETAPVRGRRGQIDHAGSGSLHPHFTAFLPRVQWLLSRLVMRCALLLVDAGDALAGIALRWECER